MGDPGHTPANVKLLLPPRQSRGNSLSGLGCIKSICCALVPSDKPDETTIVAPARSQVARIARKLVGKRRLGRDERSNLGLMSTLL